MIVKKIPAWQGKDFIKKYHYSKGCHNGPICFGLFRDDKLVGVCAFACPCSENVRRSVFGKNHKEKVIELHRLVILDSEPKFTATKLISKSLKLLLKIKPEIRGVITFADSSEGHYGTIYQASNAIYLGTTEKRRFYLDQNGRLRHPRQNGINISKEEALEKGWSCVRRGEKYKYLLLLGSRSDKRWALKNLKLIPRGFYPKKDI